MPQEEELNNYYKLAIPIIKDRLREFFVAQGLRFEESAAEDPEGWIEASGCVFNQARITVNVKNGKWRDPITDSSGNIFDFLNMTYNFRGGDNYDAVAIICKFCDIKMPERVLPVNPEDATPVSKEMLESITGRFGLKVGRRLCALTGISIETARRFKFGWFPGGDRGGEIAVPIPCADGTIKAIRVIDENHSSRWLKRIPRANKLENAQKLYGLDELQVNNWKNVILTNSEFDRAILMQEKKSEEWGVLSIIDGYSRSWNPFFYGRNVVMVFSCDHNAIASAQKVVGPVLKQDADGEHILSLKHIRLAGTGQPEDHRVYHWFKGGGTWETLMKLESLQPQYEMPGGKSKNSERKNLSSFAEIDDPKNNGLNVRVAITISGESVEVFDSIESFKVGRCKEIEKGTCLKCDGIKQEIDATSPKHLAAYGANEKEILRLCVQHCCDVAGNRPTIVDLERSTYRKVIASQCYSTMIDRDADKDGIILDGKNQRMIQKQIIVRVPPGKPEPIEPRSYMANGAIHTDPNDSSRSMIVETLEPIPEPFEIFNFQLHRDSLKAIRDIGWNGIVQDLITHRTKMHGYAELMIINLLTLCSPLRFHFNGERDQRGWIVGCFVGDTGTGKSKTYEILMKMTNCGSIFKTKTGSRTGLAYATIKSRTGGFSVQAGMLPICNRKILLIEEAQLIDEGSMKAMSEAMYDGVLEVNNVARANYQCMTRIIMNANCKLNKPLDDYALGCLALKELFDSSFIRRIDIAAFIRKFPDEEVEKYHRLNEHLSDPIVTPEMMRHLVYFAWSLSADRIEINTEVTKHIMARSIEMIARFGKPDDLTLVYASDFRITLARISVAWAVLSLSSHDDFKTIEVLKEHVDLAVNLLTSLYSHPDCGLDKYSEQWARGHSIEDYPLIRDDFHTRIVTPQGSRVGENSPFARYIGLLRSGVQARRTEIARTLRIDFKYIEDFTNYLLDHNLVRLELDRVKVTAKFNRVIDKFEKEDRAIFVNIRAASLNIEIEKEAKDHVRGDAGTKLKSD